MASKSLIFLVILSVVGTSIQNIDNNEVEPESENPFSEAFSDITKQQNSQNVVGAIANNLMQGGVAESIMEDVFSNLDGEQILQGLGSLMSAGKKKQSEEDGGSGNVLEGLGSILGAMQGAGGQGGAGDLLQGLGTLMGGEGGEGGLDPALIGSMLNMLASQNQAKKTNSKTNTGKNKVGKPRSKEEPDFDIGSILSLVGSFMGQNQGQGKNLMSYLPMIMQTFQSFMGPEAKERERSHSGHAASVPPVWEKLHVYFDHFVHSDGGKYLLSALGAEKAFEVFTDEKGRFDYGKFSEKMENHSFRRHWIRMVTDRVVVLMQYASDPKTQKLYLSNGQFLVNQLLQSQGFPRSTQFNPAQPTESITALVNYVAKKYLDMKINAREYVKPAVEYVKELLRLTSTSGKVGLSESRELSNKLTDTINLEIIEPVVRVSRAYRFANSVPSCDRYVLCLMNEENQNEVQTLPQLKKLLYKGSSLLAGWFLSSKTGTPFWTLYTDITGDKSCKGLYSEKCGAFHDEELKVTTEYVHTEL